MDKTYLIQNILDNILWVNVCDVYVVSIIYLFIYIF